ncbi:MAG: aminoglycoside phosphotransferase family protein [Candidatus Peregrinibacteria bacterium]
MSIMNTADNPAPKRNVKALSSPLSQLISNVIENDLKEQPRNIAPILGGDESKTFSVTTDRSVRIVKLQPENDYRRFSKEQWCLEQSSRAGIPGPTVLSVGKRAGMAYIILTLIPGTIPKNSEGEKERIWKHLGAYARRFHAIPVKGFGHNTNKPGVFEDSSWLRFLDDNIRSLTGTDKLIQLNVLNVKQSVSVRQKFEELRKISFTFGLCHGDLSLLNVLVGENGTVYLYDWGQAEANIVPYFDLIGILENHPKMADPELDLFLQGYGVDRATLAHLDVLWLLKRIDKLRWAIDKSPKDIKEFSSLVQIRLRLMGMNS